MKGTRRPPGLRVHGDVQGERESAWDEVYRLVRRIPKGRVMTYGQVATEIENRLSPRAVGWAMHGCPESVPWHRVVNAAGGCSTDRLPGFPVGLQRAMLESEGVRFRTSGTLDLAKYRWQARPKAARKRP
jgi:methylated-DNA-protein-cysteine methyltransferase-like protein